MRPESEAFFTDLLEAPGPSGDERAAARAWRDYAAGFAEVRFDALGSGFAETNPGGSPSVAVFGHIDEIALVVVHVDDQGYVWFQPVGGWTPTVLVAQRVRILTQSGPVVGVVGQKPPHLTDAEERAKAPKIQNLWVDIGAADGDEARSRVRVGDLAVLEQPVLRLAGQRLASRAVDNRAGAVVAAEAVRLYAERGGTARLVGVATVQEETSLGGAHTTAFGLAPDAAIVVDVTHCSDYSGVEKTRLGDIRLGRGPVVNRGAGIHATMADLAVKTATAEGIPFQLEATSGRTGTDADAVSLVRAGIPSCVISVPNRYMHSPNEVVDLDDLEATAVLVAAVARALDNVPDLA
ncbi:MAG: M20/M25/M40 family metallo-hydrolase [Gaiellales bacterium]